MPAIAQRESKKSFGKGNSFPQNSDQRFGGWLASSLISLATGALLGLSAPGIGLWFVAWVGLLPLLLLIADSKNGWQAAWRGFLFGTAYNLVYLNWYLGLQPLDWLGFNGWQGILLAAAAWLIVSMHQGLLVSLFSGICRIIPMKGSIFPERVKQRWIAPALLTVPLLWILATNKLGNAHYILGVPWSMLEYSQYKQIALLQICSIIGGIGLGFLIVLVNTSMAIMFSSFYDKKNATVFSASNKVQALHQFIVVGLLMACVTFFGFWQCSKKQALPVTNVSVLQGNINIEMQKTVHSYTLTELLARYLNMAGHCPSGLCIWTESALPAYLSRESNTLSLLSSFSKNHHLDMVVGAMDLDGRRHAYNSAFGISRNGAISPAVYHKRYLVPFGEYTPSVVRSFPEWILRLTNTPAGGGFDSGRDAAVLDLSCGNVGPFICFETMSPELVASSVRRGAELLVNVSDLAWFHRSMIGDQMVAFSALRAVESNRYFVFAANTGPSTIIDPMGRIKEISAIGKQRILIGKVGFTSDLTAFSRWFIF